MSTLMTFFLKGKSYLEIWKAVFIKNSTALCKIIKIKELDGQQGKPWGRKQIVFITFSGILAAWALFEVMIESSSKTLLQEF